MSLETRLIHVNGIDLNVLDAGDGPPVLLLHGFPDDHTLWRHQIPALVAAGYRVIAPDTRGCGRSQLLPRVADYRFKHLVADQIALLDALGIDRVRLIGHDWGAVQGWQIALRHPERVERYMAMSVGHPYCYLRAGWRQKLKGWYVFAFQARAVARWLFSLGGWTLFGRLLRFPEEWPFVRERIARPGRFAAGQNYYVANLGALVTARAQPVSMPVTGVFSTGDIALVERQMTDSAPLAPSGWHYERLANVNHWMQLSAPQRVTTLMLDFLRHPQ